MHTIPATRRPAHDGFMIVEVIVSALLIGLVVAATLTGFDVASRMTADERAHAQAALLAAQSQEQLRTDPASTLAVLERQPHTYTRTLGKNTFTITQEARSVGASEQTTGCKSSESSAQTTANFKITSTVTWAALKTRPAVKQSSIVTPPTGSGLEVDVENGAVPPLPVSGVTAIIKYTPAGSGSTTIQEGTTGATGCVVFSAIPATSVTVEIAQRVGFVTTSGALKYPAKELSIAPNLTTHDPVTLNEGGRITANFTYKGATSYEREAGKPETVRGDTFVAYNSSVSAEPKFEVGSSSFGPLSNVGEYEKGGEELYRPLTGGEHYAQAASTAAGTKYPTGDLFPFSNEWLVYGGDCTKNSPETATEATEKLKGTAALVKAGTTTTVNVPLSYTLLNVRSGTQFKPGAIEATAYSVTITDPECSPGTIPNNALSTNLKHAQSSNAQGHLEFPFEPFGKYELCVFNKGHTYRVTKVNSTVAGTTANVYLGEQTQAEREATEAETRAKREAKQNETRTKREAKENETRTKREATESETRTKREATEAETRTKREAKEAETRAKRVKTEETERETWKAEEKAGKIKKSQRTAKEKTQTEARGKAEAAEATAKAKAESEEAGPRKTEEQKEAEAKKKAETAESETRTKAETAETEASKKAEAEESEAKKKAEQQEKEKEDTVASGQASC